MLPPTKDCKELSASKAFAVGVYRHYIATRHNATCGSVKVPAHVGRTAAGHMTKNLNSVRTDLVPTCPRLADEGKCTNAKILLLHAPYVRTSTDSGAVTLPVTLPSKERAAAAVRGTLAYDMAEIKKMLYGNIKVSSKNRLSKR